jgi:hypothetical protein
MPTTVVRCCHGDCTESASYKIAACWSVGRLTELKTYGFACSDHLGSVFRDSERRRMEYSPIAGEDVEELGIYKYGEGQRDRQLQRLWGLERNYRG